MTAVDAGEAGQPGTLLKSYRYLRSTMVGLVLCLGIAVVVQSIQQGSILSSISAYYFTPAGAIFVGVLVAMGACMIALKGTQQWEDALLNIAGMLAPVVAIVPTGRFKDYRQAVDACRNPTGPDAVAEPLEGLDCLKVIELREATEANVINNMIALLAVGAVGLVVTWWFAKRDGATTAKFWRGFVAAVLVYAVGLVGFAFFTDGFFDRAHFPAAVLMFGCIIGVAVSNALRRENLNLAQTQGIPAKASALAGTLRASDAYARVYAWIAGAMLVIVVVGVVLYFKESFSDTVFWVEALLIVLFGSFWAVQTAERWDRDYQREAG
jgi:hypothetical protein